MIGGALAPVDVLADLMERGPIPALRAELIDRFGDVVQMLEAKGWLRCAPAPSHTECRLCNRGHSAELRFDPVAEVGRYWCVEAGGWGEVPMLDLESRVLNLDLALKDIREALRPVSFLVEVRLPGLLWRLGESSCGGTRWTTMFARDVCNDRLARCLAYLPRVSTVPGLVLTSSRTPAELCEIAGFRFAGLGTVLDLDHDGNFVVNGGALRAALGRAPASERPRGRPTSRDEIYDVVGNLTDEEAVLGENTLLPIIRERLSPGAPALKDRAFLAHIQGALKKRAKNPKT